MINWIHAGPVVTAAFLGSLVECVEALTIVLAVGTARGWRSALVGTAGAGRGCPGRAGCAPAAVAGSREHAEVLGWRSAGKLRRLLGRRGSRLSVARRRSLGHRPGGGRPRVEPARHRNRAAASWWACEGP